MLSIRVARAVGLSFGLLAWLVGCHEGEEADPCSEVDCSGHGTCYESGSSALCDCDPGFHAAGLECRADGTDGDGDSDADNDADSDGEADAEGCPDGWECCSDGDCANGSYCDGEERCDDGACRPGAPVVCGANEECDEETGSCACANEECGGACCAAGQVCHSGSGLCCTPDCGGLFCGLDSACGVVSCGACEAHETCVGGACECVRGCGGGACEAGEWATVCAGSFVMGSPLGEVGRGTDEALHDVALTRDFEILSTEVTQDEFLSAMGYSRAGFPSCGGDCPIEEVSWHEAAAYCNALSDDASLEECYDCTGSAPFVTCAPAAAYPDPYGCPGYRLPTEAEWEYAARAGTTTATYNGDLATTSCPIGVLEPIAWTDCNAASSTHAVGHLVPNGWGLYDALGNVWEWCHDWYAAYPGVPTSDPWGPATGTERVRRGGSWRYDAWAARAAQRGQADPSVYVAHIGFRPARTLP